MPLHSGLTGASLHESKGAAAATAGQVAVADGAGAAAFGQITNNTVPTGWPVQSSMSVTTALVDCTTAMPVDDTIPQNTEGTEVLTHAHTPRSTTNILLITVCIGGAQPNTAGVHMGVALFQDSTASALAAVSQTASEDSSENITFMYKMTAGTTSATTFKVRLGSSTGAQVRVNSGNGLGRAFGGVGITSIRVDEYKAS